MEICHTHKNRKNQNLKLLSKITPEKKNKNKVVYDNILCSFL